MRGLAAVVCFVALPLAAQCTKRDASCTERFPLGPEGRYSIVYRSYPLNTANASIRRALIVIHGAGRDADNYFASAMAGAMLAGALDDTLVIAPRIASTKGCSDTLQPGEISWTCTGADDWRRGGASSDVPELTTYGFIDALVERLSRKELFPNLRSIVLTGHSAGGQFINRYAAATKVAGSATFVVANPSSYLYLDDMRMKPGGECNAEGRCTGEFVPFKQDCEIFNQWHYGLLNRSGYAKDIPDADLKQQLISRNVVYLLGDLDTLPRAGFDSSCGAMAQGASRFARGLNYYNYMRTKFGARHKLVVVELCGHNGRCMYTSETSLPILFPK